MDLSINHHGQMAGRVQAGRSPPLRRRRTREYVPNSQTKRPTKQEASNHEVNATEKVAGGLFDEKMNSNSARNRSDSQRSEQLGERYHILKAENKILRERLQNALQREMKALKTFKRLAKENRQLKLNLRKYERTLLGFYEDESDSDPNDVTAREREDQLHAATKRLTLPPVKSRRSYSADSDLSGRTTDDEPHGPASLPTTKSVSTLTEDTFISKRTKHDRSTSTHDLLTWDVIRSRSNSRNTDEDGESVISQRKDSNSSLDNNENNLTDSTKVRLLHRQLVDLQGQTMIERRKYSDICRYSSGLTHDTNNLYRTSSSRSIETPDNQDEPAENIWRRVPDGSIACSPPGDFQLPRLRHSLHEDELETVLEDPTSRDSYHEDAINKESYESSSILFEGLVRQSSIHPFTNNDGESQRSPRSSPPTLTVDVSTENLYKDNEERFNQSLNHRAFRRPGLGHTVSLPTTSFEHYLSVLHEVSSTAENDEVIEEEEEEEDEPPPIYRRNRRASLDDDQVYIKKNRDKRQKKTSVSLRFDGDVPRERAETLAADIAAYLEYRKQVTSDNVESTESTSDIPESSNTSATDDEISLAESAAIARARSLSRRRGSAVVTLPGERSYQMDLHVFNKQAERLVSDGKSLMLEERRDLSGSSTSLNSIGDPEKRSRWSILKRSKKISMYGKELRRQTEDFKEALSQLRENPKEFIEHELLEYKDSHWTQFIPDNKGSNRRPQSDGFSSHSSHETKRREALWELFHSEIVYLIDHLLVLSEVFLKPLEILQDMGHLQVVEKSKIFCNLKGLCEVSSKFAEDLLLVFKGDQSKQFGNTAAVVAAFTEFGCKLQPQYQDYCLNYSKVLRYLDQCKKSDDFQEYIKLCEADPRCNRLQLTDLLVAPLQHLTKYPLLLKNIRERTTEGEDEHSSLSSVIKSVEHSIKELEGKVKSLANLERLQDLQNCLVWPSIIELDPKTYVPEFLRGILGKQPCESLLTSPKRQLLYEGPLILLENTKQDIYAFLFDDMLLLTRYRKCQQKTNKKLSLAGMSAESPPATPTVVRKITPACQYTVYKQPIPLDRFIIIDSEATHGGNTLKNSFIIIHYSRFKQTVGLYTLQAPSHNRKETWTSSLKSAQSSWSEAVAMEIANETRNAPEATLSPQSSTESEEPVPSDKASSVTNDQILSSFHKPIASHC